MTSRFACLVLSVCVLAFFAVGAAQAQAAPYLALGDSVTFGYITQAGFEYVNPRNFIGFPSYVGPNLGLSARDAACPGETTGSFLSSTAPDNGCRAFRSKFPLHVFYTSTQLAYAKQFVINHPGTKLVTLLLGANDFFLLQEACASNPNPATCISNGLPAVLAKITANLVTIIRDLRATGYSGTILLLNYYSLDYSSTAETDIALALRQAIAAAAAATHVPVVDVFTAFQIAASLAGGQTCHAGLLNVDPQNQLLCDVHPSQSGQQLLALAVEIAYRALLALK